jgi:hypothetical protein
VEHLIPQSDVEALLGQLHLDDPRKLGHRESRKAVQVHALLGHLHALLRDAPRRRALRVVDAAAGRGHVAAALAALLLPAMGLRGRVLACEWDEGRVERAAARMAECGVQGVEMVGTAVAELTLDEPPDLVVGLHACGTASDDVIDLALRAGAARLALVPCCHPRRPDLLARMGIPVGGAAGDRLTAAALDGLRVQRLESARYRVDSVVLGPAAATGRDLVILARIGGGKERARLAASALSRFDQGQ